LIALAHRDIQDELAMAFDPHEHVAVTKQLVVIGPDALLLLANEGPNLVALDITHLDIPDLFSHDAFALFADKNEQFQDGRVMDFGSAFNARHAVSFEQEPQDHLGLVDWQIHAVKRRITCIGEYLAALVALVTLAILAFTELAAFGSAVVAGHCEISC
jgi:hypothetical protein